MADVLFKRIDTVFLPVRDIDAAIAWYTETLGLTLRWKSANYAALNLAETPLTLYQPERFTPVDAVPFNFYSPDADQAHRRLALQGALVMPIQEHPGIRFFDFRDPDGNLLSVCSFPEP